MSDETKQLKNQGLGDTHGVRRLAVHSAGNDRLRAEVAELPWAAATLWASSSGLAGGAVASVESCPKRI